MPFEKILEDIVSLRWVEGVVLLDREGETIFCFGTHGAENLKLLGAHQSVILGKTEKLGWTSNRTIVSVFDHRTVLTQSLKEFYFLTVIFNRDLNPAYAHHLFQDAYAALEEEL